MFGRPSVFAETPVRSASLPLFATLRASNALAARLSIPRAIIFGSGCFNAITVEAMTHPFLTAPYCRHN